MTLNHLSWGRIEAMEGDAADVSLFAYQASLLMALVAIIQDRPDIFFSDVEEIDLDTFREKTDDLINRLSKIEPP